MSSGAFLRGEAHPALTPSASAPWDIVFVDRDGTLNELRPGYRTPPDFRVLDGVPEALADLGATGAPLVLVTNQQGLATGALSWTDLQQVHQVLVTALADCGADLADIRICPHLAGTCTCRKPQPGLLDAVFAANPWARRARCLFIGDSDADAGAAQAAGVPFERVRSGRTLADVVDAQLGHRDTFIKFS